MKNSKLKAKEGMTLIEVIISVTLLSILIVPLSALVMSSLKNNVSAECRQKASYVGQKVLEELKAYDQITLKGNSEKYFELLDGDKIEQNSEGKFVGSFNRTIYGGAYESTGKNENIYKVDVELEKDKNFQYNNASNLDKNSDGDFSLKFFRSGNIDKIQLGSDSRIITVTSDLVIELKKNASNLELNVFNKGDKTPIISSTKSDPVRNKVILNLKSNYEKTTNIEIKNKLSESVEVRLIKEKNSVGKINLSSSKGDVILYEEDEIEENPIADMYNYKVIVKDSKNNILFQGSTSNNVNIK
ncbi:MAG: prepilin-type N-terminal cleavage/methylation domain-containing protein [Clostridium sartagoforme]|nr:prepilin-type N-terminal cleavage/methylation domain-containing protein [Clostridium sartagoforme]